MIGNPVDRRVLEALICPETHGTLRFDAERNELISEGAGVAYPIRNGIPVMLVDEARSLDETPTAPAPSSDEADRQ
ncbi:Trm112 family protein [uncultured Tateyamaria sp.]|uniref:Trm112 family protein n=1 Tax=Tateyamaria sp. 1078 TaxID=3417464 RepID=UPI0026137948|nr:Trm112 family protein [uncultured Tateyamaria sp.]